MNIVVNPDSEGFGSTVFVKSDTRTHYVNGEPWPVKSVEIVTAHGVAVMTYEQWITLLSIGMAMTVQEGTDHE